MKFLFLPQPFYRERLLHVDDISRHRIAYPFHLSTDNRERRATRTATCTPLPVFPLSEERRGRHRYALKMYFCYFLKRLEIHSALLRGLIIAGESILSPCGMFISCACIFNSVFRTETNFPFIPQSDFLKKIERKKKFCFFAFRFRDFVIERNDSRSVSKFRDSTIKKKKKKVVREEIGGNFDSSPILAFPSLLHRSFR